MLKDNSLIVIFRVVEGKGAWVSMERRASTSKITMPSKREKSNKVLNKYLYERAKKENSCFHCFEEEHNKEACPKLGVEGSFRNTKKDYISYQHVHTI